MSTPRGTYMIFLCEKHCSFDDHGSNKECCREVFVLIQWDDWMLIESLDYKSMMHWSCLPGPWALGLEDNNWINCNDHWSLIIDWSSSLSFEWASVSSDSVTTPSDGWAAIIRIRLSLLYRKPRYNYIIEHKLNTLSLQQPSYTLCRLLWHELWHSPRPYANL